MQREPQEIRVFQLKHATSQDVLGVLAKVFVDNVEFVGGTRPKFAVDPHTNSLIVVADEHTLTSVNELLKVIDVKANVPVSPRTVLSYRLKYALPDAVQTAINLTAPEYVVSIDPRTNSIIAAGPPDGTDRIKELVKAFDVPPSIPTDAEDVSIRIVWLVDSSLAKDEAEPVPDDLTPSIEGLRRKIGLGELRMGAQILIQSAAESSEFDVSGTANLASPVKVDDGLPHRFQFQGQIRRTEHNRYTVQIYGSILRPGADGVAGQCDLRTTCGSLSVGKPVIVGTTPIDSKASVFVIQLLDQ